MIVLAVVTSGQAVAGRNDALANTCNGVSELSYPSAPNFVGVGDTVRVVLTLGAGSIQGGNTLTIGRVRFNLDCDNSNLGLNCPDDGPVVSYQGNLSSTCPTGFTADHSNGDVLPNQVVFTPGVPISIPANTSSFCTLSFDVRLEARSNDSTPDVVEEVSGYDASLGDGVCNTTPPLAAGDTNSGSIRLCPICDDNNQCNGIETCDPNLGCQPGTNPVTCNDNNVCTTDTCNPNVPPPADPCVYTPGAQGDCNDFNVCTTDFCDPTAGCLHTPGAQGDCNDNNVCTTDTCDPANGCIHTPGAQGDCNDNNVCTTDTCDPANGCIHTPGAQGDCNDNDVCTTDRCDAIQGCVHTPGAQGDCNDNDLCTTDFCDPLLGCQHTPGAQGNCDDGNVCTTDTCNPISGCTHTPNALNCDDNNVCTTDVCDPIAGCVHTPIDCDDHNACNADACEPASGCTHTVIDCNDHNKCTNDSCDPASGCVFTPIVCNDGNQCTTDTCDTATGCVYTAIDCNDHDSCTNDSCSNKLGCTHSPVVCDDSNACTTDSCDPASGCVNVTTDCNDHNKCTNDSCNPGTGCVNTPINCDDGNSCTTDACDPASGCTHTTQDCNDHDKCTNDSCNPQTGCVYTPVVCDDGNSCTTDACEPSGGCTHTTINCDDHTLCTDDSCSPGIGCVNTPINCDDQNFCTDDSCSPDAGCIHTPNNNPCEDGSVCNGHEACLHGACRHGSPLDCDDDNPCTDDCCDAVQGCLHTPVQNCLPNAASPLTAWYISAGQELPGGDVQVDAMASTVKGSFCGEIQADNGLVADPDSDHQIAGTWKHDRPQRRGELVALTYNSVAAGCDNVWDGELCPAGTAAPGAVVSPASMGCFTGVGTYTLKNGRSKTVAFRVEVEDHGTPSATGSNPGDIYRLRIWYPRNTETAAGVASTIACSVRNPEQSLRPANVSESASITAGDLKISSGIR